MTALKNLLPHVLRLVAMVLAAAVLGTLALTAVYLLPEDAMAEHMESSARLLLEEGEYPLPHSWQGSQMDNYTDTLILQNAACSGEGSPAVEAMLTPRPGITGIGNPYEVLMAHYDDGIPYDSRETYSQYWHGYLLLIKPLLLLTDYAGIRLLNGIAQTAVLLVLLALLVRKKMGRSILPVLCCVLMLMPWLTAKSLQYSPCYYGMLLGCIGVVLLPKPQPDKAVCLFAGIGIAMAYFDYLTYPLVTLGVPAALYCLRRGQMTPVQTLGEGAAVCAAWAFGYGGMWASKWGIGSLITGQNLLALAGSKLAERSSLDAGQLGMLYNVRVAVGQNMKLFLLSPLLPVALGGMIILAEWMFKRLRGRKLPLKDAVYLLLPYGILADLPLMWFTVASNHSAIHYWFTNKILVVSVFSVLCALNGLCNWLEGQAVSLRKTE